jgi:AraC-like DNA-binding protein
VQAQAPEISAIYARALLEALQAWQIDSAEFLRQAGLSPRQLADPYGWLQVSELDRLIGHALALSGDPAFGLHWAERSPMTKFDLIAMATAQAPTLRECLSGLLRFQSILWRHPELEVVERAGSVLLRVAPVATTEPSLRVRTELSVTSLVRLVRHVGAPESALLRIAFAHGPPAYLHEYVRLFAGRARFNQPCSGIEVDASWLDRRVHHANVELHQLITTQAQQVLARVQNRVGHVEQVRDHLRLVFPRLPEMRDAARALALSERSLRRRLAEEGWSYSAILQESQLRLARQLLADPTRPIKEVAFAVGFASSAAFHRAFKRWTGASPVTFRIANSHSAAGALPAVELAGSGPGPL